MISTAEITREVRAMIEEFLSQGNVVRVGWISQHIIQRKSEIEGEDADFYVACASDFVSRIAKKVVGAYEPKTQGDAALVLPGFEHLQKGYPVERDGERLLVPTDQLSDEELLARANEYDAMARGCVLHAEEIRSFVSGRKVAAE